MKYLFAFVSPMRRVWHRTGTQEMLEQEGSKGRDEDNGPRTRELFASFTISGGALRRSQKAASTSLPLLGLPYSYIPSVCGGRGGQRECWTSSMILTWSLRTLGNSQDRNGYHELFWYF